MKGKEPDMEIPELFMLNSNNYKNVNVIDNDNIKNEIKNTELK